MSPPYLLGNILSTNLLFRLTSLLSSLLMKEILPCESFLCFSSLLFSLLKCMEEKKQFLCEHCLMLFAYLYSIDVLLCDLCLCTSIQLLWWAMVLKIRVQCWNWLITMGSWNMTKEMAMHRWILNLSQNVFYCISEAYLNFRSVCE